MIISIVLVMILIYLCAQKPLIGIPVVVIVLLLGSFIVTLQNAQNKKIKKNLSEEEIKRERALLTPTLRYDILRRDGFRCQICGRSQKDGVVLHVDHIKPVSKGGKTEPSNLRTLCNYCNYGKSAKYNENELN